jgi:hypothetical protein
MCTGRDRGLGRTLAKREKQESRASCMEPWVGRGKSQDRGQLNGDPDLFLRSFLEEVRQKHLHIRGAGT